MNERSEREREPGQHAAIHEPVSPPSEPDDTDANDHADDRVQVLQPDGDEAPHAEE